MTSIHASNLGAKSAVRIANCSGAKMKPGIHMLNQVLYGNMDVITGDYLAGMIFSLLFPAFNAVDAKPYRNEQRAHLATLRLPNLEIKVQT
jgi:hypothetical protein